MEKANVVVENDVPLRTRFRDLEPGTIFATTNGSRHYIKAASSRYYLEPFAIALDDGGLYRFNLNTPMRRVEADVIITPVRRQT
jgi:hypothetical protein